MSKLPLLLELVGLLLLSLDVLIGPTRLTRIEKSIQNRLTSYAARSVPSLRERLRATFVTIASSSSGLGRIRALAALASIFLVPPLGLTAVYSYFKLEPFRVSVNVIMGWLAIGLLTVSTACSLTFAIAFIIVRFVLKQDQRPLPMNGFQFRFLALSLALMLILVVGAEKPLSVTAIVDSAARFVLFADPAGFLSIGIAAGFALWLIFIVTAELVLTPWRVALVILAGCHIALRAAARLCARLPRGVLATVGVILSVFGLAMQLMGT